MKPKNLEILSFPPRELILAKDQLRTCPSKRTAREFFEIGEGIFREKALLPGFFSFSRVSMIDYSFEEERHSLIYAKTRFGGFKTLALTCFKREGNYNYSAVSRNSHDERVNPESFNLDPSYIITLSEENNPQR